MIRFLKTLTQTYKLSPSLYKDNETGDSENKHKIAQKWFSPENEQRQEEFSEKFQKVFADYCVDLSQSPNNFYRYHQLRKKFADSYKNPHDNTGLISDEMEDDTEIKMTGEHSEAE